MGFLFFLICDPHRCASTFACSFEFMLVVFTHLDCKWWRLLSGLMPNIKAYLIICLWCVPSHTLDVLLDLILLVAGPNCTH